MTMQFRAVEPAQPAAGYIGGKRNLSRRILFYLDPPYHGTEHVYGRGLFQRSDFAAMAERLATLKGRFVLSINDHPEIRETFAAFVIEAVPVTYTVSKGASVAAGELIISGGGR